MFHDPDRCYAALASRDPRFDGWFYAGVTTTGIYCRPSCPATTPRRDHVRFFPAAGSAQVAGFRACKRCRPDATPGSPAWDHRADLVARAMRLIDDGVVDRDGVAGLAARLGYSTRHVTRQLTDELGAGPLALARAQRARTARLLIETTSLPLARVAFAAGFASVRQFNDTVREVFASTPGDLRARRGRGGEDARGADHLTLRLPLRRPAALHDVLAHLAARAVPGVEVAGADHHRRSLDLPHGGGVVALTPDGAHVRARLHLDDLRDLATAVQRCRRLLDLDADPVAVDDHLADDPVLAPLVIATPGRRVAGTVEPAETAIRTVLGQQVSVAAAATLAGRLVTRYGMPLTTPHDGITHHFPGPDVLAGAALDDVGLTGARSRAVRALATALADGSLVLDGGTDRSEVRERLRSITGIGPWTAEYVALRALGDPDAFPATDLALRRVAPRLGLPTGAGELERASQRWRPWRAYAAQHLWDLAAHPGPGDDVAAVPGPAGPAATTAARLPSPAP